MPIELGAVVVESVNPVRLSQFWAEVLGCEAADTDGLGGRVVQIHDGVVLEFVPDAVPKEGKNRLHLDLATLSDDHQTSVVRQACDLGALHVDIGQGTVPWVVLADPEGNEFCVLEPRDEYRDAGPIAAVVTDVSDPVGVSEYWSSVMGVPIVRTHPEYVSVRRDGGAWLEFVRTSSPAPYQGRLHLRLITPDGIPTDKLASRAALSGCPVCKHPSTTVIDAGGNHFCLSWF